MLEIGEGVRASMARAVASAASSTWMNEVRPCPLPTTGKRRRRISCTCCPSGEIEVPRPVEPAVPEHHALEVARSRYRRLEVLDGRQGSFRVPRRVVVQGSSSVFTHPPT